MPRELGELMDEVRDDYDVATWNEQKILSGGSYWYSPSPLQLMSDAFRSLASSIDEVEAARAELARDGAAAVFLWIEAVGESGSCRGDEVEPRRYPRWPKGNDYNGPAVYFEGRRGRALEIAPAAMPRIETIASGKKLALVVLRGDRIEVAY